MATSAVVSEDLNSYPVKCGSCLQDEGYIINPKRLPCGHTFCATCLTDGQENIQVIVCRDCKEQSGGSVDDLPSAVRRKAVCDTCERKGIQLKTARAYCVECDSKYCANHEEIHNDVNDHHQILGITEYLKSSYAREVRFCKIHKEQVLLLACIKCCIISCAKCLKSGEDCIEGGKHDFVHIEEVAEKVKATVEPLKVQAEDKFDDIAALVKEVTITVSLWDIDTEHGVRLIRSTRDEQLDALRKQYEIIEQEYVMSRAVAKDKINGYIYEEASLKMDDFLEQLKKLRASLTEHHPVDLLEAKKNIEMKIEELVSGKFPSLLISDLKQPLKRGEEGGREAEIELRSGDNLIFGDNLSSAFPVPKSLELISETDVQGFCNAVCQYEGFTYVGMDSGHIHRIDTDGYLTKNFRVLDSIKILALCALDNKVYALGRLGVAYKVFMYDFDSLKSRLWNHGDCNNFSSHGGKMCVIKKHLVVIDTTNQRITLYSLTGETIKQVPCLTIPKNKRSALCHARDESVIVTVEANSRVFKLNLTSGAVEWESTHIPHPQCVTLYGTDYVLVANRGAEMKIWILDVKSGRLIGEIADPVIRPESSAVYDMTISGDTLIISRHEERKVLFYRIK